LTNASNDPVTTDRCPSDERRESIRTPSKKTRARPTKLALSYGRDEPLQLQLPRDVTGSPELPRRMKPAPWSTPNHFTALPPSVPRRPGFQEIDDAEEPANRGSGFAGEYFVKSSMYEVINIPGLQVSRETNPRFHILQLDQFTSTIR